MSLTPRGYDEGWRHCRMACSTPPPYPQGLARRNDGAGMDMGIFMMYPDAMQWQAPDTKKLETNEGATVAIHKANPHMRVYKCKTAVTAVLAVIEKELEKRGIPIFARFDHRKNAQEVNLELRQTVVLVFGSPAVGTLLMQRNQSIAFELPLRIAVWEDENGSTCLAMPDMASLAEEYGLSDLHAVGKMQGVLDALAASVI